MLTTVDFVKSVLGIQVSSTFNDTRLANLLLIADGVVKRYCNQNFEVASYVEYYSGNNSQRLVLRQLPITTVTSVLLNNSGFFNQRQDGTGFNAGTDTLVQGTDYVPDWAYDSGMTCKSGILFRIGTVWPMIARVSTLGRLSPDQGPAFGNIQVSYTAGYSVIPGDLQGAVAWVVAFLQNNLPRGGDLRSETIGDYSYSLFERKMKVITLGDPLQILSRYKDYPW